MLLLHSTAYSRSEQHNFLYSQNVKAVTTYSEGSTHMNATYPKSRASWTTTVLISILCLASACLIGLFLVFVWTLFGTNYDFPPTWYWALTILLTVADIAVMCYITFQIIRVLIG